METDNRTPGFTSAHLFAAMNALGLTREYLAAEMGVEARTVKFWASGTYRKPLPSDLAEIIDDARETFWAHRDALRLEAFKGKPLPMFATNEALWAAFPELQGLPRELHAAVIGSILIDAPEYARLVDYAPAA